MNYLDSYTSTLNNPELEASIHKTAQEIEANLNEHLTVREDITALLLGNVQSGKTGQMLGVICKLVDCGYRIFIILTTDNIDLQRQTYNRTKNALSAFVVLSEKDERHFRPNDLSKPIVLVLKKNSRILKNWSNLIGSAYLRGGQIAIFDDEADAASLNTLVNKNRQSTINKYLDKIKKSVGSYVYFQVTATPQAVLLQSQISGWKPSFVTYFKPGTSYLGGNFFYSNPVSYCIKYTNENELDDIKEDGDVLCPKGLSDSILSFLIVCAYKRLKGETNCNFMIHPSFKIDVHQKFVTCVQEHLTLLQQSTEEDEFIKQAETAWLDLQRTKPDIPHFEYIYEKLVEILENTLICVIPLNSKSTVCRDANNPDALDLSKGYNIVVGGNTLGRGITFPHLQTVYYCRSSKTPQADTFWQHSRIFGYDREKELIRIYIPRSLLNLFVSLNEANEILIKQIEQGCEKVELVYPQGIAPTRKNVIDNKYLNMIVGGVNIFPLDPVSKYVHEMDALVSMYSSEKYVDVTPDELKKALSYTECESSVYFDKGKHISCISALACKRPSIKCRLIVRLNRDIGRGTGTLLSPDDRELGKKFHDGITLTLYRVNGNTEKGWDGLPLWIPNIKYPENVNFYGISE